MWKNDYRWHQGSPGALWGYRHECAGLHSQLSRAAGGRRAVGLMHLLDYKLANSQQRQINDMRLRMPARASLKMCERPASTQKMLDTDSHQEMPTKATRSHCDTHSALRISTRKKCKERLGPPLTVHSVGSGEPLQTETPASSRS